MPTQVGIHDLLATTEKVVMLTCVSMTGERHRPWVKGAGGW